MTDVVHPRPPRQPGPDYPITVEPHPRRVRVEAAGHVIADSADALALVEVNHGPVFYIPRKDVEMGFFGKTAHHTYCAFKGHASYYTVTIDGQVIENAVWSYEDPFPWMEAIRDHLAFYPDKVKLYEA